MVKLKKKSKPEFFRNFSGNTTQNLFKCVHFLGKKGFENYLVLEKSDLMIYISEKLQQNPNIIYYFKLLKPIKINKYQLKNFTCIIKLRKKCLATFIKLYLVEHLFVNLM